MKRDLLINSVVLCVLVALGVTVRLTSETPNFSAVAATTLFAGFFFKQRLLAMLVPLAIMTISDSFIGGYGRSVMLAVYASLLIPMLWSTTLRRGLSPWKVGGGAVSSSVAFYLITNAAVWNAWYPRTWQGLADCYGYALPFFGYTLASDLLFSAALFAGYAAVTYRSAATDTRLAASVR